MSLSDYEYSFQVTPIILIGGIATTGAMGIVTLLQSYNYKAGITGRADPGSPTFASFRPVPGHSLMNNEVATYPFANQTTAANAVITAPLDISLEMLVPATGAINASNKLSIITSLKSSLDKHTSLGGYYNIATPSYVYQGCLLTSLVDASDEDDGAQPQVRWIWNFTQPLITSQAAQAAQNPQMNTLSKQTQNSGDPPGSNTFQSQASNPSANIVQNYVPSTSGALGSNLPPPTSVESITTAPKIGGF